VTDNEFARVRAEKRILMKKKKRNKKLVGIFLTFVMFLSLSYFYNCSDFYQWRRGETVKIYENLNHPTGTVEIGRGKPSVVGWGTTYVWMTRKSESNAEEVIPLYVNELVNEDWEIEREQSADLEMYIVLRKGNQRVSFRTQKWTKEYTIGSYIYN